MMNATGCCNKWTSCPKSRSRTIANCSGLENELATDAAVAAMHEAQRIIESTAFVTHEQRQVNAEWLRRR